MRSPVVVGDDQERPLLPRSNSRSGSQVQVQLGINRSFDGGPRSEHPVSKVKQAYERPGIECPMTVATVTEAAGRMTQFSLEPTFGPKSRLCSGCGHRALRLVGQPPTHCGPTDAASRCREADLRDLDALLSRRCCLCSRRRRTRYASWKAKAAPGSMHGLKDWFRTPYMAHEKRGDLVEFDRKVSRGEVVFQEQ